MKRIRIWLSNFTLLQQFLTISFLSVAIFVFLIVSFLNNNIDRFVNDQMHVYIHRSQESFIQSKQLNGNYNDSNVSHFIYSLTTKRFLTKPNTKELQYLGLINPDVKETYDSYLVNGDDQIVYSVTPYDNVYSLISIMRNDYRREFKNSLVSGVVVVNIYVIIGSIGLILLWVVSLIMPLKSIRNYINKIKDGKNATLLNNRHDEIGEVSEALVEMNEELSKQKQIRDEMIQNVSHDLKTPIATIKSYSESIKDGIYPYGTLEKSVDVIIQHANRLEKKVYSLITYNKLGYLSDTGEKILNILMEPIIKSVVLSASVIRTDVEIETSIDEKVLFHGEEEPWRVVVENILDNALRYAKSKVSIHLEENLLEIYNDGEQIDKEHLGKMFKAYEKGTKGKFGLGLSIVKKICDTYGYIVLGENLDDGVVFRIYTDSKMKKQKETKKV